MFCGGAQPIQAKHGPGMLTQSCAGHEFIPLREHTAQTVVMHIHFALMIKVRKSETGHPGSRTCHQSGLSHPIRKKPLRNERIPILRFSRH